MTHANQRPSLDELGDALSQATASDLRRSSPPPCPPDRARRCGARGS